MHCQLSDAKAVGSKFKNASPYGFMAVSSGIALIGYPCGNQHFHGFIGMEGQAVADVVGWINKPVGTACRNRWHRDQAIENCASPPALVVSLVIL